MWWLSHFDFVMFLVSGIVKRRVIEKERKTSTKKYMRQDQSIDDDERRRMTATG